MHEDTSCATCQALQPGKQHMQDRKLTSKAMNARIGDRSIVPFNGGMIPLNRFRYGSQSVLQANNMSFCTWLHKSQQALQNGIRSKDLQHRSVLRYVS